MTQKILGVSLTSMGSIRGSRRFAWILQIGSLLIVLGAGSALPQEPKANRPSATKSASKTLKGKTTDAATLVGAGDIVGCSDLTAAEATAKLIDAIPGTVFAAGDLAYQRGTYEEFIKC